MSDADKRFEFEPKAVTNVNSPQCTQCIKNFSRLACSQFKDKPTKYLRNEVDCPYISKRK